MRRSTQEVCESAPLQPHQYVYLFFFFIFFVSLSLAGSPKENVKNVFVASIVFFFCRCVFHLICTPRIGA